MAAESDEVKARSELQLKVSEEVAHGVYANVVSCIVGDHEVTLDFIHVEPQPVDPKKSKRVGYLVSRVILGKSHLVPLIELLERQRAKLEAPDAGSSD